MGEIGAPARLLRHAELVSEAAESLLALLERERVALDAAYAPADRIAACIGGTDLDTAAGELRVFRRICGPRSCLMGQVVPGVDQPKRWISGGSGSLPRPWYRAAEVAS